MAIDLIKYKSVPKISSIIVAVAFFFPFFLIKCNGQILASIPGTTLCVGTEVSGGVGSNSESEIIKPKIFAIIGFLAAIGGIVVAFSKLKKRDFVQMLVAIFGLITLVILAAGMTMDLSDSGRAKITIELGFGYYLAVLGFIVNIIFAGLSLKETKPIIETIEVDEENTSNSVGLK